jgi:ABC-2 type transport system ATP-binding protein
MLLGILTPTSGDVLYFDKSLSSHREVLNRVNFSSTYTNLPWNLSVLECLTFSAYLYPIENRKARIAEIATIFKLEKFMKTLIRDLSSGQITRVNLAKAFLNKPDILLLDEPTASLDPESAQYIRDFILTEQKQRALSIILTSHNMHEVEEVCDRIVFLQNGQIIADNTPYALANSINISKLTLLIQSESMRQASINLATLSGIATESVGRYTTYSVLEKKIPDFLQTLQSNGIQYDEIEIRVPTLEDYFLAISKK